MRKIALTMNKMVLFALIASCLFLTFLLPTQVASAADSGYSMIAGGDSIFNLPCNCTPLDKIRSIIINLFTCSATIKVEHRDADNLVILKQESFTIHYGKYGPYLPLTFPNYGPGTLSFGSAPASGTIKARETKTIIYLYTKAKTAVTYHPNGGTGEVNIVNVIPNTSYTIRDQGYSRNGYVFSGWNTRPDGLGVPYFNNQVIYMTASIALYAQWTPCPQLTVTYHPNGGTGEVNIVNVIPNTSYSIRDQGYARDGYVFSGWNTRPDGLGVPYSNNQVIYITASITLYAQWTPCPQLTVTYYPNGGVGSIKIEYVDNHGIYTIRDQGYTRPGYTLSGWNTRADGLGIPYASNQIIYVTASIALYAQWKPDPKPTLYVVYDPNEGIGSLNVAPVGSNNIHTIQDQGYTRDGYTFSGWNTRSDGSGISYSNNQTIYVTSTIILYAQWKPDPKPQLYVIYDPNGGSGEINVITVAHSTNYTISDQGYSRDGYTFTGWNTRENGLGVPYSNNQVIYMTDSITLYAQWKPDPKPSLYVIYDPNGGRGEINVIAVAQNTNYTISDQGYSRDGYVFAGWNTRENGLGIPYINNQVIYMTASLTLYAQWAPCPQLAVTYDPNGGSGDVKVESITPNTPYTIQDQGYSRDGYVFAGWNSRADRTGIPYINNQVIYLTASLTLYAQWEPCPQLAVTYDPNGGSGDVKVENVNPNSPYTIQDQGYTRDGYVFIGWNSRADRTGIPYINNQVVYLTASLTLYAQWEQCPQLTVTYDPNGGSGDVKVENVSPNSPYTIQDQGYTRDGYVFVGWNTRADRFGFPYINNQVVYLTASLTLYAQWEQCSQLSVTYDPNGGSGDINIVSVTPNSNYTIQDQGYDRDGFIFDGWNTRADGFGVPYSNNQVIYLTTSITLYAQWRQVEFTITYHPNGGTGEIKVVNVEPYTFYTLQSQGYDRGMYFRFIGWNTESDGSGNNFAENETIYVRSSLILYARWDPIL